MHKIFSFLKSISPSILRLGMSAVILWFSLAQFLHTQQWTAYVPDSAVSMTGLSVVALVYLNAIFELVFGILLVFGIKTRLAALLLSLHLFDIMYVVGYGEIGVRDFGLALATLVVALNGPDILCIGYKSDTAEQNKTDVPIVPTIQPRRII